MKLLNVLATAFSYIIAGIHIAIDMPLMASVWILFGVINHFITLMW